ncbi:MAG: zf-HC2 domain-containing protein [Candidatus Binatia bacterium]
MTANEPAKGAPCPDLEQDLVLFHYGELDNAERQRVQAHVKECLPCMRSLEDLAHLLPKTVLADEPPAAFWNDYSRELRHKLTELGERESWWRKLFSTLRPWSMPALATSVVVALALTFTLGKAVWQTPEMPPAVDEPILEVLPMTENLDFFRNLEVLDALELLESMSDQTKGTA